MLFDVTPKKYFEMDKVKRLLTLLFVLVFFVQCDDFEGEQEIPSYLRVDGFNLVSNPDIAIVQGEDFLTCDIRDVWVYVDNELIGAYELPCVVPILKQGRHKVDIRPGVFYNGMSGTREAYPFYTTAIDTIDLIEGQEVRFENPTVMYNSTTAQFASSYEMFEDPYPDFRLAATPNEEVIKMQMLSNSDSVKYGNSCGVIYFAEGGENKYISIDSIYCTNKNGTVLELDYHSNIPFEVGVYGRSSSASAYQYVSSVRLAANEGKGWQKMYILLNKVWGNLGYPNYYHIYFEAFNPDKKSNSFIHLDNIKVVHYPNQY